MNKAMKKKKNLPVLIALTFLISIIIKPVTASAYVLETGVARFPYPYNISCTYAMEGSKNWTSYITTAKSAWNSSAATIYFQNYANSGGIDIAINSQNEGNVGYYGLTFYPTILNGHRSHMYLNDFYSNVSGYESEVVAHELGHAVGLGHVSDNADSIMRITKMLGTYKPRPDDTHGVNSFY